MKLYRGLCTAVLVFSSLTTPLGTSVQAQTGSSPNSVPGISQPIQVTETTPGISAAAARDFRRKQEEKLSSEIDKLVILTSLLKEDIGKRTPNTLPSKQIKETEEIERLSKSIRKTLKD